MKGPFPASAPVWLLAGWTGLCAAAQPHYELHPEQVAADTYVIVGRSEHFSRQNGGNIVNTTLLINFVPLIAGAVKRFVPKEMLEKEGYRVQTAANGREAHINRGSRISGPFANQQGFRCATNRLRIVDDHYL